MTTPDPETCTFPCDIGHQPPEREESPMVTDQGTTRIVFGKDSNGFIETTEGRPQEDEGAWRVYTSGYAVLGWDDLLAIGRWIAEHER